MENRREMEHKMIGLNIAYYRKLRNMTQRELAERAHISRTHISYIEAPNVPSSASLETLMDIADALNVPLASLLAFDKIEDMRA